MRREYYSLQPPRIELYSVFSGTDIILRKNIEQVEKEELQDGKEKKYTIWECEEIQYHYEGELKKEDVESRFNYWFAIAEGKKEIDAIDDQAKVDDKPSVVERLDALESGLAELAEVLCNG